MMKHLTILVGDIGFLFERYGCFFLIGVDWCGAHFGCS